VSGDNIDTDVLYPGPFLNIDDPMEMRKYLFQGLDPSLRQKLKPGCVLVVGSNFGAGSSREHVPLAMKAWEVGCILGASFARIFYRNCINQGLPAIVCPEAANAARDGSSIRVDLDAGVITVEGVDHKGIPIPPFMREMIEAGGLVPWGRARLARN
jgi:3-isopropylmalate/(R)-2-methylmalate dehydratase small subunit